MINILLQFLPLIVALLVASLVIASIRSRRRSDRVMREIRADLDAVERQLNELGWLTRGEQQPEEDI